MFKIHITRKIITDITRIFLVKIIEILYLKMLSIKIVKDTIAKNGKKITDEGL